MDLIHAAAQWGLQPMVARLVQEEPALVNAANEYGWTCLMLACSRGHVGLAAWLLDHGARVDQGDLDGLTALTHAACGRQGRRETVALLLARGADPNAAGRWGSTALMEAASLGLSGRVRALLEGAPREGPRALRLDARDAKGSTALFKACMYGRLEAARELLAAGADPIVPNNEGLSPMVATLSGGHRAKGRAIAGLLERAMLEPCRVRYLRHARFAHEAGAPASSLLQLQQQEEGTAAEQEAAAAAAVVVAPTPAVLVFQGQRLAAGQPLPQVEVQAPPPPAPSAPSSSSGSRKRPRPGASPTVMVAAAAAAVATSSPQEQQQEAAVDGATERAAAVARHVVSGGLPPALFEELMGMLAVPWDPAGRGEAVGAAEIEVAARGERAWVEANRGEVARLSERRRWRRERRGGSDDGEEEEEEGEWEVTTGDEEDDDGSSVGMEQSKYETEDEEELML